MIQEISLSKLASAQSSPPQQDDDVITLRYDAGRDIDGDPVVYAVVDSQDLCKLPVDVLSSLGVGADRRDADGDPVFFVGDGRTLRLLVDTDAFPSFKADLIDIAEDHGITLRDAQGDLRALCGPDGDIAVPDMPAFVHAGQERYRTAVALAILEDERREYQAARPRKDEDGPGSQFS